MSEKIGLIIPCYNEEQRLQSGVHAFMACPYEFLFVNDGSTDGTSQWIRSLNKPNIHLLELPANRGKAEAIRQGFLHAQSLPNFQSCDWVGYWDADLSAPLTEVETLLKYSRSFWAADPQVLCGSRVYRLGARIDRSYTRHIAGRLFATVSKLLLPELKTYDSQCGAKLFRWPAAEAAFRELFISRWLFDIEILLRLRHVMIVECPLLKWTEVPGSRFNIYRNAPSVFRDLIQVHRQYP